MGGWHSLLNQLPSHLSVHLPSLFTHDAPLSPHPHPLQAVFWVQVMRDLRHGVKLKKVQERQYNPLAIEFQLTPYEMLMDDIRSKRYKLRKVMVGPRAQEPSCWDFVSMGFLMAWGHPPPQLICFVCRARYHC